MMRSEEDIRREVEGRLRRRGLWIAHAGLWLFLGFGLFAFVKNNSFGRYDGPIILLMFLWTGLLGLHTLAVLYVEMRDRLVRQAIVQEREFYALQTAYEKRKRDESASLNGYESRPLLSDDGELIEFPDHEYEDDDYAQRKRNS